jgi:hypothetical protein
MKRIGLVLFVMGLTVAPTAGQQTLDFAGRTWVVTAPDAKVASHLGREALLLRNGGVFLPDAEFGSGVIEYDVATTGHRSFVGAALHLRQGERTTYEEFYLRPHQTGRFDATQYTPNYGGLTAWQLYPEYNAPVEIPRDEWVHVRLVISGARMEAFIGGAEEPTLVVEELRMGGRSGGLGLYSNFPEAAALALYPTAFSNFTFTRGASVEAAEAAPVERPDGVIGSWAISASEAAEAGALTALDSDALASRAWDVIDTDAMGRINIAEERAFPAGARQGRVYARVTIHAPAAQDATLHFGFSDRGSVFLNGRLLFTGDNTYRSRSLRYLGVMTLNNDALVLPLRAGENELVIAVTEAFGGWGINARLEGDGGLRVIAEPPGG